MLGAQGFPVVCDANWGARGDCRLKVYGRQKIGLNDGCFWVHKAACRYFDIAVARAGI